MAWFDMGDPQALNLAQRFVQPGRYPGPAGGPPGRTIPEARPSASSLPSTASKVAGARAFGQRGAQQRRKASPGTVLPTGPVSGQFFQLPDIGQFSQTPVGMDLLRRAIARQFPQGS